MDIKSRKTKLSCSITKVDKEWIESIASSKNATISAVISCIIKHCKSECMGLTKSE